jgi:hypothetical protein
MGKILNVFLSGKRDKRREENAPLNHRPQVLRYSIRRLFGNGTEGLEPRFLSRCRTVEFSSYGMASDITAFLDRVWHSEGGNGNGPDFSRVAKDSRNNVRDALMTLEVELMAL